MNKNNSRALFFIVALLWGSSFAVQKPILEVIDPVVFTFWNFFISGCAFFVYALIKKIPLTFRLREGIYLGLLLSGLEILQTIGLKETSSANTVFLSNIGMLMIPYIGYLLYGHKVGKANTFAIIIAGIGMYLLTGGLSVFGIGEGVLLLSAIFCGAYFFFSERFEAEKDSKLIALCVHQFFTISFVCLIWGFFVGSSFSIARNVQLELLWQIVLFTTIPYTLIQVASKYADEMVAAIYDGVIEPLTGAFVSWVVFLEVTTFSRVVGGMIMIFSFIFSALFSKRHFILHWAKNLRVEKSK